MQVFFWIFYGKKGNWPRWSNIKVMAFWGVFQCGDSQMWMHEGKEFRGMTLRGILVHKKAGIPFVLFFLLKSVWKVDWFVGNVSNKSLNQCWVWLSMIVSHCVWMSPLQTTKSKYWSIGFTLPKSMASTFEQNNLIYNCWRNYSHHSASNLHNC